MNQFYPAFTLKSVGGLQAFLSATLVCALMSERFAFDPQHKALSDVREHIIAAAPVKHRIKEELLGFEDVVFERIEGNATAGSVVFFVVTPSPETSALVAYMDQVQVFPLNTHQGGTTRLMLTSPSANLGSLT